MKTAALITHTHPPDDASEADGDRAREAAESQPAGAWSRTAEELAKHGDAAGGIEAGRGAAESARPLPGARRRRLDPPRAAPLRRHRRAGLRRQLRHRRLPRRGRARRAADGLDARPRRRDRDDRPAGARGRTSRRPHPLASTTSSSSAAPHDRVAELTYRIAGEEVGHVRCDGLVAATPAGSTGYNLANQGPILAWGVKGYVVSYISPHSLTARALVVAPGRRPPRRQRGRARAGRRRGRRRARSPSSPAGDELEVRFVDGVGTLAQLPGIELLPADPREVRPPRGLGLAG